MEETVEPIRDMTGGDGGGDGGVFVNEKVAAGGTGLSGIIPPGIVPFGFSTSVSGTAVGNRAPDWLTILIASLACLYACINARHAPETERMVERKKMTMDWNE